MSRKDLTIEEAAMTSTSAASKETELGSMTNGYFFQGRTCRDSRYCVGLEGFCLSGRNSVKTVPLQPAFWLLFSVRDA